MEERVECIVELTEENKDVRVSISTEESLVENCISIFNMIIGCVMEANAEFFHSIKPQFFIFDPSQEDSYLDNSNLFAMRDVERILMSSEKKQAVLSVNGNREMKRSNFSCFRYLTLWNILFPIDTVSVLDYLKDVVRSLFLLGLNLDIPESIIEAIKENFPTDISRSRMEMVRWWISSQDPPCWWKLVQALRVVERGDIADAIETKYSEY